MAKIYKHMKQLQRKASYFNQVIGELKSTREDCNEKIDFYEALLAELGLCPRCKGHGQLREYYNQDESKTVLCSMCDGTGLRSNDEDN